MTLSITKRYAQALFDASVESQKEDAVYRDLGNVNELICHSGELGQFLSNPTISRQKRGMIIEKLFRKKLDHLTYQFVCFLEHKDRLSLLKDVYGVYELLHFKARGMTKVSISSGIPLNDSQLKELKKHLKTRFNKDIEAQVHIDPAMLGGVKIQNEDTVYDYSLRTQLEDFRKNVINA